MFNFDREWEWADIIDKIEAAKDCENDEHEWQYVWRDDSDPNEEKHVMICMKCRLCMYDTKDGKQTYWRVNRKTESP